MNWLRHGWHCIQVFALEVSLLNDLSHPNIVKVIGFIEYAKNGIAWMVLPWEKNGNLREFVASAAWEFPERLSLVRHFRHPPIRVRYSQICRYMMLRKGLITCTVESLLSVTAI